MPYGLQAYKKQSNISEDHLYIHKERREAEIEREGEREGQREREGEREETKEEGRK